MKIVSSFKDYYDSAIGYGVDPKLIYVRESKEIELDNSIHKDMIECLDCMPKDNRIGYPGGYMRPISTGVIAFCGKLYPYYEVPSFRKSKSKYYYSFASLEESINKKSFIDKIINDNSISDNSELKKLENFVNEIRDKVKYLREMKISPWRKSISFKSHDETYIGKAIDDEAFISVNAPIITFTYFQYENRERKDRLSPVYTYKADINPRLNEYNFISKFDPYACFQELAMYIGNNMAKQVDPSVNFSDELKADIHGFDKWSFRKPGKKSK